MIRRKKIERWWWLLSKSQKLTRISIPPTSSFTSSALKAMSLRSERSTVYDQTWNVFLSLSEYFLNSSTTWRHKRNVLNRNLRDLEEKVSNYHLCSTTLQHPLRLCITRLVHVPQHNIAAVLGELRRVDLWSLVFSKILFTSNAISRPSPEPAPVIRQMSPEDGVQRSKINFSTYPWWTSSGALPWAGTSWRSQ